MQFRSAFIALWTATSIYGCGGGASTPDSITSALDDGAVAGLLAAPITEAQATRFLWKSSFGPTTASIARLRQLGYAKFVDEQLSISPGRFNNYLLERGPDFNLSTNWLDYCAQYPGSQSVCFDWIFFPLSRAASLPFFKSAVVDSDQINLRMAWALSQILVVSNNFETAKPYGNLRYQQLLRTGALGNYKDLLLKISLSPYMGQWLTLIGSHRSNPNQNYARELLQLFSVGIYQRKPDGTFALNEAGHKIENYTQQHVREFARALTGWGFSNPSGNFYFNDMQPIDGNHDSGSKMLLNGHILRANLSTREDLEAVIDNVFQHSSTAPNIVRQLIQFLVTSNPSPAYVARVVRVWNNNGQGIKGDLKAVARAIFLDSEALNPPDTAGRLLEPVIALTGLIRAIGGRTDGAALDEAAASMQQRPFSAPSVFNFYTPEYQLPLPGPRRHGPQFGIVTLSTVVARLNAAHRLIFSEAIAPDPTIPSGLSTGTALQWPAQWVALASSQVPALIDVLNVRLVGGALEPEQRNYISAQVSAMASGSDAANLHRLRMATWLVFSSPQFMAHR